MHILILNGSPKGQYSVTLQTINYLERLHPQHTFEVLHVGQRIKALEKDFAQQVNWQSLQVYLIKQFDIITRLVCWNQWNSQRLATNFTARHLWKFYREFSC